MPLSNDPMLDPTKDLLVSRVPPPPDDPPGWIGDPRDLYNIPDDPSQPWTFKPKPPTSYGLLYDQPAFRGPWLLYAGLWWAIDVVMVVTAIRVLWR